MSKKLPMEARKYLAEIGRKGGKAKTAKKRKAVTKNLKARCPKCKRGWRSTHHTTTCTP